MKHEHQEYMTNIKNKKKSTPRGHDKYEKSTPGGQDKDMKNQYQEDRTKICKINTRRTGQKYEKSIPGVHDKYQEPAPG